MEIKMEAKEQYKCRLFVSAVPHANDKHLRTWREDFFMVKGLDKDRDQAQPWLACVFRRACRVDALWMFEHLQWQWITPVDPLWFHLHLSGCCRKSTADNLSLTSCAVPSHTTSSGNLLFTSNKLLSEGLTLRVPFKSNVPSILIIQLCSQKKKC